MEQQEKGRSHKKWYEDEVNSLIKELSENLPKDEIAKRSPKVS